MEAGLTDPITLELLVDPICTPCCGHTFSRLSLQSHLERVPTCAMCRANISKDYPSFDAQYAPKNVTVEFLVDKYKQARLKRKKGKDSSVADGGTVSASDGGGSSSGDDDDSIFPDVDDGGGGGDDGSSAGAEEAEEEEEEPSGPTWSCKLSPVLGHDGKSFGVNRISVDVEWPSFQGETCVFIPVIDKSGSMSGKPFDQVKTSLLHMLRATLANRNVFTTIVLYESRASKIMVPRDGSAETERWRAVENQISDLRAGGGTNFRAAFEEIRKVLVGDTQGGKLKIAKPYKRGTKEFEEQRRLGRMGLLAKGAPAFVTSAIVVFLTDGRDNSGLGADRLVESLKTNMRDWTKKLTVHTVGFGRSHDHSFLDALRKVGTSEGLYRFADPGDDGDTLATKLSELASSIISSTALVARLAAPWLRLRRGGDGDDDGDGDEDGATLTFTMHEGRASIEMFATTHTHGDADEEGSSSGTATRTVQLSYPSPGTAEWISSSVPVAIAPEAPCGGAEASVAAATTEAGEDGGWSAWVRHLLDEFMQEILRLAGGGAVQSNARRLHCAFLLQRAKRLELHLHGDEGALARLHMGTQQVEGMLRGGKADVLRLKDAGTTAASSSSAKARGGGTTRSASMRSSASAATRRTFRVGPRIAFSFRHLDPAPMERKRFSPLHMAVIRGSVALVESLVASSSAAAEQVDGCGETPLHVACYIGRLNVLRVLLGASSRSAMNAPNHAGHTPLALAMMNGHWKTVDILMGGQYGECTLHSSHDTEELLRGVIARQYFNTAGRIIAAGIASVDEGLLAGAVPPETLEWVMRKRTEAALAATASAHALEGAAAASAKADQAMYLSKAVENGMASLVSTLLGLDGVVDEGAGGSSDAERVGATPSLELLKQCCTLRENGPEIARLLLRAGLSPDALEDPHIPDAHGGDCAAEHKGKEPKEEGREEASSIPDERETLLFQCAAKGLPEMVEVLIEFGADVNWRNHRGNTPLWVACAKKRIDCIAMLLNSGTCDVNLANAKGCVPLVNACQNNHCAAVAMLLAAGARVPWNDETPDANTPVLVCCRMGHDVILNTLLSHVRKTGGSCVVERELAKVASIDGFNPMLAAAEQDASECIRVLHRYGASVVARTADDNAILPGATPLHVAAYYGRLEAAKALLALGVDVNVQTTRPGGSLTPLHIAVRQGNLLLVRLFKAGGADAALRDGKNRLALFYCNAEEIRSELADPALPQLMAAARDATAAVHSTIQVIRRHAGMLGCLSPAEAVDVEGGDGWTPLMEACARWNGPMVAALLAAGSDPHRRSADGVSASLLLHLLDVEVPEGLLCAPTEWEARALEALERLKAKDVRNILLLQPLEQERPASSSTAAGETPSNNVLSRKMASAGPPVLSSECATKPSSLRLKSTASCTLPTLLSKIGRSSTAFPAGEDIMRALTNKARLYGISWAVRSTSQQQQQEEEEEKHGETEGKGKSPLVGAHGEDMSLSHVVALHAFTSSADLFASINRYVRNGESGGVLAPLLSMLIRAVRLLPPLNRVVDGVGEAFVRLEKFPTEMLRKGAMVKFPGFVSCSLSWGNAVGDLSSKRNISHSEATLIIRGENIRVVGPHTTTQGDEEALVLPFTQFEVVNWYIGDVISLGQANIRGRAHDHMVATTGDVPKALRPGQALIIELEEREE